MLIKEDSNVKFKKLAFRLLIGVLFSFELFAPLMVIAETFDSSQVVVETIEAESEDENPSIITSSSPIDDTIDNLLIPEIPDPEILETESTISVEAIQAENWHKDENVHILTIKISRSTPFNEWIDVDGLGLLTNFRLTDVVVKNENGVLSGGAEILNRSTILTYGEPGTFFIKVFAHFTNVTDVTVDENNYFDFGRFSVSYRTTNQDVIGEADSLTSVLLKAGVVQENHMDTVGNPLVDTYTFFGMPGDDYSIPARNVPELAEYRLVDIQGEVDGTFTIEPIAIDFIYTPKRLEFSALNHLDFDFGEVYQSGYGQTIFAENETAPTFVISDYSRSTTWNLQVSQPEGFKDSSNGNVLEGAVVTLSGFRNIASVHGTIRLNQSEIELSPASSIIATMVNPFNDEENGETIIGIGDVEQGHLTGVKLTLRGNTIQNIGDYHTSIVWELVGDPTLGVGE